MARPLGPAFHAAQVRDALGLVRLLFAVEREGTDITRAAQLTEIGTTLRECLDLAHMRSPETLGYRAAVTRSGEAMDRLAWMDWPADVAKLVRVAQARVKGVEPRKLDQRDQKKAAADRHGPLGAELGAGQRGGRRIDGLSASTTHVLSGDRVHAEDVGHGRDHAASGTRARCREQGPKPGDVRGVSVLLVEEGGHGGVDLLGGEAGAPLQRLPIDALAAVRQLLKIPGDDRQK